MRLLYLVYFSSIIALPSVMTGCGGGGGSVSDKRKKGLGTIDVRTQPLNVPGGGAGERALDLERKWKPTGIIPLRVVNATNMRESFFPRSSGKSGKNRCPKTTPEKWTDTWAETCRKYRQERRNIFYRDSKSSTTTFPDLNGYQGGEIVPTLDGQDNFSITEGQIGLEAAVFNGTSYADGKKAVFKYGVNCFEVYYNRMCDGVIARSGGVPSDECSLQSNEDPILSEYVIMKLLNDNEKNPNSFRLVPKVYALSAPVKMGTSSLNQKTQQWIMTDKNIGNFCRAPDNNVFLRLLVEEEVGPTLGSCFNYLMKESSIQNSTNREILAIFAINSFIEILIMLQEMHRIGFLHGDIHSGNIVFESEKCEFKNPNLLLIDFGMAEFFPHNIERKQQHDHHLSYHPSSDSTTQSASELNGQLRGRHDDVYHAFEILINMLSGGKLLELYRFMKSEIIPETLPSYLKELKEGLTKTADSPDGGRSTEIFGRSGSSDLAPNIKGAINNYSGISFVEQAFDISSRDGAKKILREMEQLVRGVLRDDAPNYDGLLEQANHLLSLLNQKS